MDQGVTGSPVRGKALGYRNHTSTSGRTGCAPEWEEPNDQPRGCRRTSECRSPWAPGRSPKGKVGPENGSRIGDRGQVPPSATTALQTGRPHQPGDPAAGAADTFALQGCVDAGGSVGAARLLVDRGDLTGRFGITDRPRTGFSGSAGVEGGSGDLQQFTRALDVVAAPILRPDERVHRHRVSFEKKAVARLRMSTSSRSLRFSHRNAAGSSRSLLVSHLVHPVDLGLVDPRPNCGLGEIEVLGDLSDPSGHHDGGARRSRP